MASLTAPLFALNVKINKLEQLKYTLTFAQARSTGAGVYQSNYKAYPFIVVNAAGDVACFSYNAVDKIYQLDTVYNHADVSALTSRFSGYKFSRSQRSVLTLANSRVSV